MASGHALAEHRRAGRRVQIQTLHGEPRWSEMWDGLPYIVHPRESAGDFVTIKNGAGCRPYIRYPFTRESGLRFSGWRARDHVGEIRFSTEELDFAEMVSKQFGGDFILLEPTLKPQSNANKDWGFERWQALTDLLTRRGYALVQVGPRETRLLKGAHHIETATFRFGAAVLQRARLSILPEGGLHHAAAVLNVPAVVLFGGTVDVEATGYPSQDNILDEGPGSPCGKWSPCRHCAAVWERIVPSYVAERALQKMGTPIARAI